MGLINELSGYKISNEEGLEVNGGLEVNEELEVKKIDLNEQVKVFEKVTNKSFVGFHDKYLPKLIHFCLKYFRNDEEKARDNAQDALMIALSKIETHYDADKASFSTWLFTIARNEALQKLKKEARMPQTSMDVKVDEEGTTIKEFLEDSSVSDNYYKDETELNKRKDAITKECINKLKPNFKEVIVMRHIDNMSYKDISDTLGEDLIFEIECNGEFMKLKNDISEVYSITDLDGNKIPYEAEYRTDSPFITHMKFDGKCIINARVPFNLSTVKSRIRAGRLKLQEMVREDFVKLNGMYF